ncbi:hypothetical protein [Roseisolibacter sp. H3M3-2]|uniref:hypothetical protein n=1 Tax=Roseisolibacter sp. H3M3-2 TaxID=3031323 RepID=UPI0023DA5F4B|nr:hypothetical protein [Roseisolibacter sp. H3M3-2]MDF1504413.1 hypothetical protein [Roseisolibacter sp. H3M3-2]
MDLTSDSPLGGLGSRAHIRQTLERARAAIRSSKAQTLRSRLVLANAEALAGASQRSIEASLALRAQLRASITAYVHRLRAEGEPPQRMLVLVKTAMREGTPPELDVFEARELMSDAVRWSIVAYYQAA